MFAVLKTGGKQYKVAVHDVIKVEKLAGEAGETVTFDQVLMHGGDGGVTIGAPLVDGAVVTGEILEQFRGEKIIAFKKRRRKHSSARRKGHRQYLTRVRIAGIPGDEDGSKTPKPERPAKLVEVPVEDTEPEVEMSYELVEDTETAAPEAEAETDAAAVTPPADEIKGFKRPGNLLDAAVEDGDDLTKLPGLGRASQRELNAIGVFYYSQFNEWGPEDWDYIEAYVETELENRVDVERASIMVQVKKLLEGRDGPDGE